MLIDGYTFMEHGKLHEYSKHSKKKKVGVEIHTTGSGYLRKHKVTKSDQDALSRGLKPGDFDYQAGLDSLITYYQKNYTSHLLIGRDGEKLQFVPVDTYSPHSGIQSKAWGLYKQGFETWSQYAYDTLGTLGKLKSLKPEGTKKWYRTTNGKMWSKYRFFLERWGETSPLWRRPNYELIGVDLQGWARNSEPTDQQYDELVKLLRTLFELGCMSVEPGKGTIVRHQDVNPIFRHNWDPGDKFDLDYVINEVCAKPFLSAEVPPAPDYNELAEELEKFESPLDEEPPLVDTAPTPAPTKKQSVWVRVFASIASMLGRFFGGK